LNGPPATNLIVPTFTKNVKVGQPALEGFDIEIVEQVAVLLGKVKSQL
jgi:hypothetical protein